MGWSTGRVVGQNAHVASGARAADAFGTDSAASIFATLSARKRAGGGCKILAVRLHRRHRRRAARQVRFHFGAFVGSTDATRGPPVLRICTPPGPILWKPNRFGGPMEALGVHVAMDWKVEGAISLGGAYDIPPSRGSPIRC